MKILLTNDDGIFSEGIATMRKALEPHHDVWTVAPDVERSGMSHAITLKDAVRVSEVGDRSYSCSGTPADCILHSLLGAIDVEPDLVISGINYGPNIGTDIVYSGTVAAARQAALMKRPAVAVSLVGMQGPLNFELAAQFVSQNVELIAELWLPDHFLNINVPNVFDESPPAVLTHPARRIYRDHLEQFTSPSGERYFFLLGTLDEAELEHGSDFEAVTDHKISVSPVYLHPVNHSEDGAYQAAEFVTPGLDVGV